MHKNMYKDFVERQNIEQYPSTEKKNTAYILAPFTESKFNKCLGEKI
jgi:hypothetical protein